MSKILSIGTAVPRFKHRQEDILDFMQRVYAPDEPGRRKLKFLYHKGGIQYRYSVIPDYGLPASEWQFYPPSENLEPFPSLETRMQWFRNFAGELSLNAIRDCIPDEDIARVTHLITVTCTGMSAPGLDIELMERLKLPATLNRTSINFMGCYAAIHALKLADAYVRSDARARVLVVCTELCTLHFQRDATVDNITSSMLFGDGAAAVLVGNDADRGIFIDHFYSAVAVKGKKDMAWELSSSGFRMTLSAYIADLIGEDFNELVTRALEEKKLTKSDITQWCIHPGGRKILEAIHESIGFSNGQLEHCHAILKDFGNMSSATILFVLKRILDTMDSDRRQRIFGAAFGPGLTMETFILST